MAEARQKIEELLKQLEQQRDELRLKLHLAKAEARDEWEKLERQRELLRAKLAYPRDVAADSAKDVGAAAKQLAGKIPSGYERIRGQL